MATDNSLLNQQSWLLKCIAIELRTLAVNRQRSHTQMLINLLLDDNPNPAHKSKPLSNYIKVIFKANEFVIKDK